VKKIRSIGPSQRGGGKSHQRELLAHYLVPKVQLKKGREREIGGEALEAEGGRGLPPTVLNPPLGSGVSGVGDGRVEEGKKGKDASIQTEWAQAVSDQKEEPRVEYLWHQKRESSGEAVGTREPNN